MKRITTSRGRATRGRRRPRPLAPPRRRSPLLWVLLAGGLLFASSTWGSAGRSPAAPAPDAQSQHARSQARGLHALAVDALFPATEQAHPREDLRRLRSELAALAAEIAAAQTDASEARLQTLGHRRQAAEEAFATLRDRFRGRGRAELAAELEALFAALWGEIDQALTSSPEGRSERLAAARAQIDAALSGPRRLHGSAFSTLAFDSER